MATGQRVDRLKDMVDRIERLPPSAERDRLLSEIRSRAVDLETGETPRAMLPMREPATAPAVTRLSKRAGASKSLLRPPAGEVAPARPAAGAGGSPERLAAFAWNGERLSLEDGPDSPSPDGQAPDGAAAPWTRGLRG